MKKILLSLACVSALSVNAQNSLESIVISPNETSSFEGIMTENDAIRHNAMVYDAQKSLFVAGVFDTEFAGLEPIASSSYIMKKNSDFQIDWKVAIKGAATVTALVSDGNGGVYAAGTIADEVEFVGTDGNSVIKKGLEEYGAYLSSQCVSFVAHYDAEGKLVNVGTITPTVDPALEETFMYYPVDGDVFCKINSLSIVNGKLYASAIFSNQISTANGLESLAAGVIDAWGGGFYYMSNQAGIVIEINEKMEAISFPFQIKANAYVIDDQKVRSITMTSDNSNLYIGVVATGDESYKAFETADNFSFFNDGLGTLGYGHIVFSINPETKSVATTNWETITLDEFQINYIKDIKATDDNIILAGTFNTALAFDKDKTPVGADDMYVVSLSKKDLSVNWSTVTNFDEGAANDNEEIFTAMTVAGNYVYLSGYGAVKKDHVLTTPLSYILDATTGDIKSIDQPEYVFGLASTNDGNKLAKAHTTAEMTGINFSDFGITSGINDTFTESALNVVAYPNPATDYLFFSATCDV